ncbi:hypothetical protein PWG15_30490 (plasmid) [Ensifer adhaerens]|uniref:hypothetical protein n=1 Tax=Ensifer adhaerens TaxID=106592 RepID=UPI0023A92CDB|nr:hypothetical protein [Ensifer adhaerens]WDZ79761.1 hypothetical protein PWG15_30490 [Ensifer adhaerens]
MTDTDHLKTIEKRLLWSSHWMIHHANRVRPKIDGIKTGGHFGRNNRRSLSAFPARP